MFCEFASCHKIVGKCENCLKIVLRLFVNLGPVYPRSVILSGILSSRHGDGRNVGITLSFGVTLVDIDDWWEHIAGWWSNRSLLLFFLLLLLLLMMMFSMSSVSMMFPARLRLFATSPTAVSCFAQSLQNSCMHAMCPYVLKTRNFGDDYVVYCHQILSDNRFFFGVAPRLQLFLRILWSL